MGRSGTRRAHRQRRNRAPIVYLVGVGRIQPGGRVVSLATPTEMLKKDVLGLGPEPVAEVFRQVAEKGMGVVSEMYPAGAWKKGTGVVSDTYSGGRGSGSVRPETTPFPFFQAHRQDGDWCRAGEEIAEVVGPAAALLIAERTALNFLQRLSGIATRTRAFVDAAENILVRL